MTTQRTTSKLARLFFGLALLLGLTSFIPQIASAQEVGPTDTGSIALNPSIERLALKAGTSQTSKLTVINDGSSPYTFVVYSRPFSVKDEEYTPQFEATTKYTDIYQWISFETTSYKLNPGQRIEVPYTVHTPANAAPGGHYAVIFAETQPDSTQAESVQRKKRVGAILQASVEGEVTSSGRILDMTADFWQSTPPLRVSSKVENTGNIDFYAKVDTEIKDLFGTVKGKDSREYIVYPGTVRKIDVDWDKAAWFGVYSVSQTVKVLDETQSLSRYVLIMPRWLILLFGALLIAGIGYVVLRHKRR